ncbi:NUDIX hydrolase [Piscibacillus sp. B03]|uniref:NUDIX hydrolase n=1 Tax=Piscibacillus sp. B03 TaxID=3457430 RepID=UPI003FCC2C3D
MRKSFSRVFIKDNNNNFLVIRDREHLWNLPGGKQEPGETPMECAKREVQEEVGLVVSDLKEVYKGDFVFGGIQWRGYFYLAKQIEGTPTINELDKIKDIQFIKDDQEVTFSSEITKVIQSTFDRYQLELVKWK